MTRKGFLFFITAGGISMTSSLIQLLRMQTFSPGRRRVHSDQRNRSCSERETVFMIVMVSGSVCHLIAGRGVVMGGAKTLLTFREAL